jgi:hypothetical protein
MSAIKHFLIVAVTEGVNITAVDMLDNKVKNETTHYLDCHIHIDNKYLSIYDADNFFITSIDHGLYTILN